MRALAFQAYVTDALRILTETTAQGFGKGAYLNVRFHELIKSEPIDTRSGDEIKSTMLRKLKELGHG